ncbi:MAG: hypothetical protein LBU40_00465, partial [Methanobrevibacter sp.]|nr:hypothetical protein [Methanobrevibacter sp.]
MSETPEFANWYKSFADTLSIEFRKKMPIIFILTGYPEKLRVLHEHNPSFSRLFKHIEIGELSESEIKN